MHALNPEAVLVSEHFHDAGTDLAAGGWHANMNYSAFTRPVWTWLVDPAARPRASSACRCRSRAATGCPWSTTMRDFDSTVPWAVTTHQWNMLGSHDTARLRTVVGTRERVELAAGLLFTYPGTPAMFAGDEGGLTGTNGEHARVAMPWDEIDAGGGPRWDAATFEIYRSLIAVRRGSRALREGGMRWAVVDARRGRVPARDARRAGARRWSPARPGRASTCRGTCSRRARRRRTCTAVATSGCGRTPPAAGRRTRGAGLAVGVIVTLAP